MDITAGEPGQSSHSVQSPLKTTLITGAKITGSVHTLAVEEGEATLKSDYELARDRRVAALQEILKPVQKAATAL